MSWTKHTQNNALEAPQYTLSLIEQNVGLTFSFFYYQETPYLLFMNFTDLFYCSYCFSVGLLTVQNSLVFNFGKNVFLEDIKFCNTYR